MDRIDGASGNSRVSGEIGSRQGQGFGAFHACREPAMMMAARYLFLAALRHRHARHPAFSHP
jgi:hypothetical protein